MQLTPKDRGEGFGKSYSRPCRNIVNVSAGQQLSGHVHASDSGQPAGDSRVREGQVRRFRSPSRGAANPVMRKRRRFRSCEHADKPRCGERVGDSSRLFSPEGGRAFQLFRTADSRLCQQRSGIQFEPRFNDCRAGAEQPRYGSWQISNGRAATQNDRSCDFFGQLEVV